MEIDHTESRVKTDKRPTLNRHQLFINTRLARYTGWVVWHLPE